MRESVPHGSQSVPARPSTRQSRYVRPAGQSCNRNRESPPCKPLAIPSPFPPRALAASIRGRGTPDRSIRATQVQAPENLDRSPDDSLCGPVDLILFDHVSLLRVSPCSSLSDLCVLCGSLIFMSS